MNEYTDADAIERARDEGHIHEAATTRNLPRTRYGYAPVRAIRPGVEGEPATVDFTYWTTVADLMASGMSPRPLYSERRYIDTLGPTRLGFYLILRRVYFALPRRVSDTRLIRRLWRLNRGR